MEGFDRKSNEVDITITAPSDNDRERSDMSDEDEEYDAYDVDHSASSGESYDRRESYDRKENIKENEEDQNGGGVEEELCDGFKNGASLSEEKPAREEREGNGESNGGQASEQAYEIVGDRVLVEKDGKFELVDANEIKAEYFEMLGIKNEDTGGDRSKAEAETSAKKEESSKQRPKTTPVGGDRKNTQRPKRAQSSWGDRYRNNEYDKIRSPYGLSEKQLEIKKRREEAIARRRKEEDEREQEEERRKREDAESAFQAWLSSKREEEKERRKETVIEQTEESEMRASESEKAFEAWKAAKKRQKQDEREESTKRMEETASMYVIHDRGACEEAFRRWLKKKKDNKKAKELEKKKKRRPRHKRKEPLPTNSDKIRFTDNHGYRNTVVY